MLHGAVGTGGLPPSPCLHPVVDTFLFYANLSFSYAVPLFFLCSMAQVGRGVSLHLHVSILLSTRFFFMLICPFLMLSPSFSYAPWRRWDGGSPSISMSPSCCRPVCFLMPTCLSLMRAVSPFMPSVFFCMAGFAPPAHGLSSCGNSASQHINHNQHYG